MIDSWLFNDNVNFRHYFSIELDEEMVMNGDHVKGFSVLNTLRLGGHIYAFFLTRGPQDYT